jgi:hypothetical protein
MLGKIVGIQENTVFLKLNVNLSEMQSIINLYVLLEDKERKMKSRADKWINDNGFTEKFKG